MGRTFRVVARAPATALIRPDEKLEINYELDGTPIKLIFRTRYLNRGYQALLPGDLYLDAEGAAKDLITAAGMFTNAGRDIAAWLSFSANAAVVPLEPEIAFESTPGIERREHFQRYIPPDSFAHTSRFFDLDATLRLLDAANSSSERDRLTRAISQYSEALLLWKSGSELPALSHLFMGIEAIKVAAWRTYCLRNNISKEELAATWGFIDGGRLPIEHFLNQEARKRLVFQGDDACHRTAREVSDAFEHGFANSGSLYEAASKSLIPAASYLRNAILETSGVDSNIRSVLQSDAFKPPRGRGGVDTYIRSVLTGPSDGLNADNIEYPHFIWTPGIKNVAFDDQTQKYRFEPQDTLTACIGPAAKFSEFKYEVWDASGFHPTENTNA